MLKKKTRYPIRYDIQPSELVDAGTHWVMLHLENVGELDIKSLSINLSSLDDHALDVHGTGSYLDVLRVGEEQAVPFQLTANRSGMVYAVIEGWEDGNAFSWESLGMSIKVGEEVAELARFFALTEPYPVLGTPITCEAVVHANIACRDLVLEFWLETPQGTGESLDKLGTEPMVAGEETKYSVQFTPEREGIYVVHAYLFDGNRRIGHLMDHVSATI